MRVNAEKSQYFGYEATCFENEFSRPVYFGRFISLREMINALETHGVCAEKITVRVDRKRNTSRRVIWHDITPSK